MAAGRQAGHWSSSWGTYILIPDLQTRGRQRGEEEEEEERERREREKRREGGGERGEERGWA